jgi:uncharacterized OB-fold protein
MRCVPAPKPVPVPDPLSQGFWDAASAGQLAIQRCDHCGHYAHPPVRVCRACLADEPAFSFAAVSGRGHLRTWTVARTAFLPAFEADLPWVVADVELVEQRDLRVVAPLIDGIEGALEIGAPVEVVFDERPEGPPVPCFRLLPVPA